VADLRPASSAYEVSKTGPAGVHAHQHLGEVGRVHAARPGSDGDQRLASVVLAGEEGAHLELLHRLVYAL
jgi:hypothetical protein